MRYNWEYPDWPNFTYKANASNKRLAEFLFKSGQITGMVTGLGDIDQTETTLEMIVVEAIKTSEIEGEFLSRQDIMSSIKKNLGILKNQPLLVKNQRAKGIAKLMIQVRSSFAKPLK